MGIYITNSRNEVIIYDTIEVGMIVDFSEAGERCGRNYTNYFDNPEIELLFPNYGAKIRLSEKP